MNHKTPRDRNVEDTGPKRLTGKDWRRKSNREDGLFYEATVKTLADPGEVLGMFKLNKSRKVQGIMSLVSFWIFG